MRTIARILNFLIRLPVKFLAFWLLIYLVVNAKSYKKPLWIIARQYNRLGNRLILFSHLAASAIENNCLLIDPTFYDYADFFESTKNDFFCRIPAPSAGSRKHKILRFIFSELVSEVSFWVHKVQFRYLATVLLGDEAYLDLNSEKFLSCIRGKKVVFFRGWRFRDPLNFLKHADTFRKHFTPVMHLQAAAARAVETARKNCDVLVGVHIRRTDSASLEKIIGGYTRKRFGVDTSVSVFYDWDTYKQVLKKMETLFKGKRVAFLICSDERIDQRFFDDFNVALGPGHFVEDLYALARCDYIIGPASTFSGWAAFYGKIPLFWMMSPDVELISLDRFQIPYVMNGVEIPMPNSEVFIY